ncbi:MAG TPA: glycosyltransferase family A protein, partial [Thermoanaerobaculia bacterium]|nr:glycosyltransferase family A protein [Thermoanaerobaculia bacterium]
MPVFNGADYVAEAIESALAQSATEVEVVAVDDGSTDATPAVLAGFGDRIRVVRKPNGGLSSARNAGIDATTTELLGFLDADDLLPREFAASMLAAAAARPDVEVFHCGF